MLDFTENDVLTVYGRLSERYNLILTLTTLLDDAFTVDCPIIVGRAHEQIIQLYACEGLFVIDVLNEEQTMCTHWHPYSIESAIEDITEFMEGKSDYPLQKLPTN